MSQPTIQQAFEQAVRHHQSGELQAAERLYLRILARQPGHAAALHLRGVLARQLGRPDQAVDLIRQALARNPAMAEAHYNLGVALGDQGQWDAASAAFRQALALKPNLPEAHYNLGLALHSLGQLDGASAACRQAIALRPRYPEAYSNLGNSLKGLGRVEEAIAAYRQALALNPGYAPAWSNLGNALRDQGQLDAACAACRQAIALQPDFPEACNNLGNALKDQGQFAAAAAAYRQALAGNARFAEAHSNLGDALHAQGQLAAAGAACRQAIALHPGLAEAHGNLAIILKDQGQLDDAIAAYRQAAALAPDHAGIHSNLVFTLHYHPAYDAPALAAEHRLWNQRHAEPLRKFIPPHANDRAPERRLRIGYVSPDFRDHVVGRFLLPLLAHHDKRQVEIFAYAQVPVPDAITRRLRSHVDGWRSLVGLSDAQAADLIRQDQVDILVDLALHTGDNRLLVFARKPAPVQATYLAYCSTTGLTAIDYRLSDPHLDPPGIDESVYSERTVRLPETYWCYQPAGHPPVAPPPALGAGHITFGSLNNFCKASAPALTTWARLLQAVPQAQLLLMAPEGAPRQRTAELFERLGVNPLRLCFAGHLPLLEYLQLYQRIDIALDPFPFGGGATTCDALWMGVPVVSLAGGTAVGRGGLSILSNLGLAELAASTAEQYLRIAAALAHDLPRLADLRSTLRARMEQSPLMDGPRFARHIEAAYRQMWRQWRPSAGAAT